MAFCAPGAWCCASRAWFCAFALTNKHTPLRVPIASFCTFVNAGPNMVHNFQCVVVDRFRETIVRNMFLHVLAASIRQGLPCRIAHGANNHLSETINTCDIYNDCQYDAYYTNITHKVSLYIYVDYIYIYIYCSLPLHYSHVCTMCHMRYSVGCCHTHQCRSQQKVVQTIVAHLLQMIQPCNNICYNVVLFAANVWYIHIHCIFS